MLFSLVKKDFLLVKKYLAVMSAAAFGFPVLLSIQAGSINSGFLFFFLTALIIQYILFNSVSMIEYKYKGSALLCTTPYTRSASVKAKYLFNLAVFICCYIIYTIAALLFPVKVVLLNISAFGLSLLITAVIFGIIIPVQYHFGYEKAKLTITFFIFIIPFVVPAMLKFLQTNNVNLNIQLPFPPIVQSLLPLLFAIIIGFISMLISISIYAKKDL